MRCVISVNIYERLLYLCAMRGVKITNVVKKLGIGTGQPTFWKQGRNINTEYLIKLAEYFGCSLDYLILGRDEPMNVTAFNYAQNCNGNINFNGENNTLNSTQNNDFSKNIYIEPNQKCPFCGNKLKNTKTINSDEISGFYIRCICPECGCFVVPGYVTYAMMSYCKMVQDRTNSPCEWFKYDVEKIHMFLQKNKDIKYADALNTQFENDAICFFVGDVDEWYLFNQLVKPDFETKVIPQKTLMI